MLRVIFLLLCLGGVLTVKAESAQYRLGAGDLIDISIYNEPDLSLEVRIGLSGKISFPLLGDLTVAGFSPEEVEIHLLERLKGPYLVDPSVTVSIIEYRPFYVTGEVKKPGSYSFHPGLTVDKAISIAGGFTERASKNKIFVIHDEGDQLTINQSDRKSSKGKRVKLYDVVEPGDVITVETSFF